MVGRGVKSGGRAKKKKILRVKDTRQGTAPQTNRETCTSVWRLHVTAINQGGQEKTTNDGKDGKDRGSRPEEKFNVLLDSRTLG